MALGTFWAEVAVRNPLFKRGMSHLDRPRIKSQELDAALSEKNEWQFGGPVRGFDEADLDFLPEDKRRKLAERVQEFNDLASKLRTLVNRKRSNEGVLEEMEVANRARPLLRDIVLSIEQDRYTDPDALVIGKQVEQRLTPLPPQLDHLRFETGSDHSGYPALWVWAYLSAAASDSDEQVKRSAGQLRPILREAAREVAPDRFPYVSFRSVSDPVVEGASR